ncbi:Hsp70 ATPase ssc1 [Tulasnella sp. 419]|nr:Hsp70 ATPase ssc1 [Tulasnella sp. 419]
MSRNLQAAEYAEPSTVDVLILTSFIFILNISRGIFETLIHAGLIGEIAVGIIYGTPLAKLLHSSWETTFRDLGYIGLIIIVLEGQN